MCIYLDQLRNWMDFIGKIIGKRVNKINNFAEVFEDMNFVRTFLIKC